jgi:hypothetical protein
MNRAGVRIGLGAVFVIAAVFILTSGFTTGVDQRREPGEPNKRNECSAPVRQLLEPARPAHPTLTTSANEVVAIRYHDAQPYCKDVGRPRAALGAALLLAAGLAAWPRRVKARDPVG